MVYYRADIVAIVNKQMPVQTWSWTPDYGLEKETEVAVSKMRFGDGYSQRVRFGLNTENASFSVTLSNRPATTVDAMEAFLSQHGGVDYFLWPDFNDPTNLTKQQKVTCDKWKRTWSAPHHDTLTMVLTKVFDT